MHFGGFEIGQTLRQTFVVTNVGPVARRVIVAPPTTAHFELRSRRPRGLLAPGMSDTVTVSFTPNELRYYYDCVRVKAEGDRKGSSKGGSNDEGAGSNTSGTSNNLLLPIHAYPVMNEVAFPSVVDFGLRAAGETHRRTIAMTCKTPIAFEFELALTTESGAFDVRPRRGIVPANGAAEIEITYAPTKLQTTVTDVVVKVSQFGFEPMRCSLRGTGFPSAARRDDARRPPFFEDRGAKKTRGGTLLHASDVGLQAEGFVAGNTQRPEQRQRPEPPPGHRPFEGTGGGGAEGFRLYASGSDPKALAATYNARGAEASGVGVAARTRKASGALGGGAGGGDAYTEYVRRAVRSAANDSRVGGSNPPRGRGGVAAELSAMFELKASGKDALEAGFGDDIGGARAMASKGPRARRFEGARRAAGKKGAESKARRLSSRGGVVAAPDSSSDDDSRSGEQQRRSSSAERFVDGVHVPRRLRGGADVNYVLNQREGKMRAEDLRRAVAEKEATEDASLSLRRSADLASDAVDAARQRARERRLADALAIAKGELRLWGPDSRDSGDAKPGEETNPHEEEKEEEIDDGDAAAADLGAAASSSSSPGWARLRGALGGDPTGFSAGFGVDHHTRSENVAMAAVEDPTLDRRVADLVFDREWERQKDWERRKAWQNVGAAVGREPLGAEERAAVAKRREARANAVAALETAAVMERLAAGRGAEKGASYFVDEEEENFKAEEKAAEKAEKAEKAAAEEEGVEGGDARARAEETPASKSKASSRREDPLLPRFDLDAADSWSLRAEALDRFAQAGRRVVVRNRAEKRLRGIRALLANVGDASKASAYVAKDILLSGKGGGGKKDDHSALEAVRGRAKLANARVYGSTRRTPLFPVARGSAFRDRGLVHVDPDPRANYSPWESAEPTPLIEPLRVNLTLAHTKEDAAFRWPALDGDGQPPDADQFPPSELLVGAEEELGGWRGDHRLPLGPQAYPELFALEPGSLAAAQKRAEKRCVEKLRKEGLVTRVWPHEQTLHHPPVPVWGGDLFRSIRPGVYGMPKTGPSLSREDAGERHASNAMIAHACAIGGATLASAYLPRRERGWGSAVRAPEPLKGPDPKHLLGDADGEGFGGTGAEVPPPARAPTMEYVRANFVIPRGPEEEEPTPAAAAAGGTDGNADAGEGEEPAESADGASRLTDEGVTGVSGEGGEANAAKAGGDANAEAAAAAKKEDAKRSTRLPTTARALAEARMEAEARAKREALAERTRRRAESFAAKIKHPKLKFEL